MNAEMAWRREELKLDMLESLARSQRALSVMLEGAAAVIRADGSPLASEEAVRHLETLVRYQAALAEQLIGLAPRQPIFSPPGLPWINEEDGVAGPFGIA